MNDSGGGSREPAPGDLEAVRVARARAHALTDAVFDSMGQPGAAGAADPGERALSAAMTAAAGLATENARLEAQARGQQAWQRAMAEVTSRLLAEAEPGDVLDLVTRFARELSGAELTQLAVPTSDGQHVQLVSAVGAGAPARIGEVYPLDGTLAQIVMASGRVLVIDDFATDERVPELGRRLLRLGPAVVFPLGSPGDVRGVLTAGQPPGAPPLAPDKVEMVTTFAAQAGIGLKLADHRRNAQRLALLADRDRIARDLHDRVIQRLFATGMSLQGALPLMMSPAAVDRVRHSVDDLDEAIRDVRAAIFTLQPRDAPDLPGLRTQIVEVADGMTGYLGFAPTLRLDGALDLRVPPDLTGDLLMVLREALSNVARHARATTAEVSVEAGRELVAVVADNGVGLSKMRRWGGLAGVTRRAAELGGSVNLRPADGGGARLEWRVPLAAPSRA
ncbi:MAG TPA: histidine kinase [Streptosporangiaceae bacterium]|nr:histidine kinase [Streptosporangiaceae bacterium]